MAVARDLLEAVVVCLPPVARRELTLLLTGLDEELWRRTLPDAYAHRQAWRRGRWWHFRIYDETSHL
ncbi:MULTISPECIES: hypothetical protein [unclassified Streptomyces]|uniref:hypothetical protein n=1 Tax=unclassified Streptomyces TaxID=2593676 RepID=UPI002E3652A5|nr:MULTISPECIES: hypothetical protein [unclassified Streptomyces]WUC68990.1 hypothetical protein OG861_32555 [Streptomyces sp. NBC_00539]